MVKKQTKRSVPYAQIAKLWAQGKSYSDISKATGRWNPKLDDPTKPMRAIVSRMLNAGYQNSKGQRQLQPRRQMRRIGVGKTFHAKKSGAASKRSLRSSSKGENRG